MATSIFIPATCPMCGFVLSGQTNSDVQVHMLMHVAVSGKLTSEAMIGPRDQSDDW